jgi:hypothetical protein
LGRGKQKLNAEDAKEKMQRARRFRVEEDEV